MIATTVIDDSNVGPVKARPGRPKKNMMIIDAKSYGYKSIVAL